MIFVKLGMGAVMVAALAVEDPSCAPPPPSSGGGGATVRQSCDMRVARGPWLERQPDVGVIRATVHVECSLPLPRTHIMSVWLERDISDLGGGKGTWIIQSSPSWAKTVPDAAGFNVTAQTNCTFISTTKRWRVMAEAKGVGPSGTGFTFQLPESESQPTPLKCR